ncbi:hypothetical protein K431DRAFT_298531 [Polychaeton citri CBS 116435]|uniref:Uncharacterized protein n=1 Tax=Polychaeton citri CBS 116435 TaxID=1314669 RepID=A0A9P4UKA6_9PEZI|nr:hypothetical protein K431DRAFT_298531 [Polychaeton citri CBS 116435]
MINRRQHNTCINGQQFYVCFGFSGCCAVDPCTGTAGQTISCPSTTRTSYSKSQVPSTRQTTSRETSFRQLTSTPATLSISQVSSQSSNTINASSSVDPVTTTDTQMTTTTSSTAPTGVVSTPADLHNQTNGDGLIAGGVLGGLTILALVVFAIICCRRRRKRHIDEKKQATIRSIRGPMEARCWAPNNTQQRATADVFGPAGHVSKSPSQSHPARSASGKWRSRSSDVKTILIGFYRGPHELSQGDNGLSATFSVPHEKKEPGANGAVGDNITHGSQSSISSSEIETLPPTVIVPHNRQKVRRIHPQEAVEQSERPATTSQCPVLDQSLTPKTLSILSPNSAVSDSPTLGRDSSFLQRIRSLKTTRASRLVDSSLNGRHVLAWNSYDPRHASALGGHIENRENELKLASTMHNTKQKPTPKTPSRDIQKVSPSSMISPSESSFVISPMSDFYRGNG